MFNDKFLERVSRLIEVRLAERRKQIPLEIAKIQRENNARGMLNSSMTILQTKEICEREIEIRAVVVWQSLVRVINTLGYESKEILRNDLKEYLLNSIAENFDELTGILNQNLRNMMKPEQVSMSEAKNHAMSKHEIEIDLYVDTLKDNEKTSQSSSGSHNYNFYGTIGSVQTGSGAQANIVQNLGSEDQEAIKQALALASEAIQAATDIVDTKKNELIEIASQARNELEKETPNSTMLQSMFVTIGTTIQTLASAKPAYQALKGALIPLGIMLP